MRDSLTPPPKPDASLDPGVEISYGGSQGFWLIVLIITGFAVLMLMRFL